VDEGSGVQQATVASSDAANPSSPRGSPMTPRRVCGRWPAAPWYATIRRFRGSTSE
jgi:hypothetical protein